MRSILHWTKQYRPQDFQKKTLLQPDQVVDAVIAHLRQGREANAHKGTANCRICRMPLGSTDRTDGTFVWPDQTEHYIIAHQVWTPEHEILANAVVYNIPPPPPGPQKGPRSAKGSSRGARSTEGARRRDGRTKMASPLSLDDAISEDPTRVLDGPPIETIEQLDAFMGATPSSDGDFDFELDGDLFSEGETGNENSKIPLPDSVVGRSAPVLPKSSIDDLLDEPVAPKRKVRSPERRPRALLPGPTPDGSTRGAGYNGHGHQPEEDNVHQGTVEYGAVGDPAASIAAAYPQAGIALARAIVATARHIGANPFDLANLIHFESAHSFRSDIQHPKSKATGLIQFYPGYTKKRLGVTTDYLSTLTPVQQMTWVQTYFDKVRGDKPLNTTQKVAMAVFYPAAIGWSPSKAFPSKVQAANRGITNPADYVRLMMRGAKLKPGMIPTAEPGLLSQLWAAVNPWGETSTDVPAPSAAPSVAPAGQIARREPDRTSWNISDGTTARLVGTGGAPFSPGALPAGSYRLEQWTGQAWAPATAAPLTLKAGFEYQLSTLNGQLNWGERPRA